jgi:hypothetical protein
MRLAFGLCDALPVASLARDCMVYTRTSAAKLFREQPSCAKQAAHMQHCGLTVPEANTKHAEMRRKRRAALNPMKRARPWLPVTIRAATTGQTVTEVTRQGKAKLFRERYSCAKHASHQRTAEPFR